jgi:hypothetical protein
MKVAKDYDQLSALPQWVVVRTASQIVRERGRDGEWYEMGVNGSPEWEEPDFPVTVLWSYAQEIAPPPILPQSPHGTVLPYTISPIGGGLHSTGAPG